MIRCYQLLFLFAMFLTSKVNGACYQDMLKSSPTTDVTGQSKTEFYCEDSDGRHAINSTWSRDHPDCIKCNCHTYGLSCCGYGRKAGAIAIPDDCKLAEGTCEIKPVKKDDPSRPCFGDPAISPPHGTKKKCSAKRKPSN